MKKTLIIFIIILLFLSLMIIILPKKETEKNKMTFKTIDMSEAQKIFKEKGDYIILDVRTKAEFEDGHIPNAINIPNETINNNEISELPNKEQLIYVYCRSGNRSKQAATKLVRIGYSNIVEFGGIIDWEGEIEK